jgi:molybdopterin-guanine dinucleotide biosynthesis protein A
MRVRHLFISPGHNYRGHHGGPAGENPILARSSIECVAGRGIVGDRYFDYQPDFKGQITFFDFENLLRMWEELRIPEDQRDPAATRRNVLLEGCDLNALIGREFELQGVRFLGMEECKPCYWMNGAIHPEAEAWMRGRGGLRAKILLGGRLELTQPEISPFSVLLTGGASTRMGTDKVQLEIAGQPLWNRQLGLLQSLGGPVAVASGTRPKWLPEGVPWLPDIAGAKGPLAGLLAAVRWAREASASHLLALAVDLPCMEASVLRALLGACQPKQGVTPVVKHHFEPLATIYPVEAEPVLQTAVSASRWKLQDAVEELVRQGLLRPLAVTREAAFHNMNTPEEIPR